MVGERAMLDTMKKGTFKHKSVLEQVDSDEDQASEETESIANSDVYQLIVDDPSAAMAFIEKDLRKT